MRRSVVAILPVCGALFAVGGLGAPGATAQNSRTAAGQQTATAGDNSIIFQFITIVQRAHRLPSGRRPRPGVFCEARLNHDVTIPAGQTSELAPCGPAGHPARFPRGMYQLTFSGTVQIACTHTVCARRGRPEDSDCHCNTPLFSQLTVLAQGSEVLSARGELAPNPDFAETVGLGQRIGSFQLSSTGTPTIAVRADRCDYDQDPGLTRHCIIKAGSTIRYQRVR